MDPGAGYFGSRSGGFTRLYAFPVVPGGRCREGGVRLGLVPVGDRADIVLKRQEAALAAPAEDLNGYPQILIETYRVQDMEAVERVAVADGIDVPSGRTFPVS